jgi:hypothetical protein
MAVYSASKCYLVKNNLHYFTFSPKSKKPIMAVIRHLPPDTPAENTSNSLQDLDFNVINVRQMTASDGEAYVETLPLFLATLVRNSNRRKVTNSNSNYPTRQHT